MVLYYSEYAKLLKKKVLKDMKGHTLGDLENTLQLECFSCVL